jgi:hypothetical protein
MTRTEDKIYRYEARGDNISAVREGHQSTLVLNIGTSGGGLTRSQVLSLRDVLEAALHDWPERT